jgi:hypothetical protein
MSNTATDWYFFASPGTLLTTPHDGTKFGNQFFYQWGVARNIAYKSDKWILSAILEFDGIYSQKDKIKGCIDPNSGSNIIFVGPVLFFTTQRLYSQIGIAFPALQQLNGKQNTNKFLIEADLRWKFN